MLTCYLVGRKLDTMLTDNPITNLIVGLSLIFAAAWALFFYKGRHVANGKYKPRHAYNEDCVPLMWDNRCGYIHRLQRNTT